MHVHAAKSAGSESSSNEVHYHTREHMLKHKKDID